MQWRKGHYGVTHSTFKFCVTARKCRPHDFCNNLYGSIFFYIFPSIQLVPFNNMEGIVYFFHVLETEFFQNGYLHIYEVVNTTFFGHIYLLV